MSSPVQADHKLLVWGMEGIERAALAQAAQASRMPFVEGHVALMPDAHVGIGATVGSVIPTRGAIMPAAVGVDIGCGMIASRTSLHAEDLPDNLASLMQLIEQRIPAGVGRGHDTSPRADALKLTGEQPGTALTGKQRGKAESQFGTLGAGNHFVEVCLDEDGVVWTVLHSGSRGIGNELARTHIDGAKRVMREMFIKLKDPDLAYYVQGQPAFKHYISDMLWAQRYAFESRAQMNIAVNRSLFESVGRGEVLQTVNCHHNFTEMEHHGGKDLWITRKGAIRMRVGDWGIIPGSMGADTYIVTGRGSSASYCSSSHGAGRRMSRSQAKRELTAESLAEAMGGQEWNRDSAQSLVDEHPEAYKDISQVMAAQADLCYVESRLHSVLNYKGVK